MMPIRVVGRAALQIEGAASWWLANRTAPPTAFRDDLEQAFSLISEQPSIGAAATNSALTGVRRAFLGRIRYFLYYYYRVQPDQAKILALWHSNGGREPEV
jgi:plasmid stabilization system protein ParE